MKIFILDSSSLITPYRTYYSPNIVPTFWKKLEETIKKGIVCTIDKVMEEVKQGDDELKAWFSEVFSPIPPVPFLQRKDTDSLFAFEEWGEYKKVISWAMEAAQYSEDAKYEFSDYNKADAFLVAFCKAHGLILVTEEKYNPEIKKRIPIPNACEALGVKYISLFELMEKVGIIL